MKNEICETCGKEMERANNLPPIHEWYCQNCGTKISRAGDLIVPELLKWKRFDENPPQLTEDNLDIIAASEGMEPGEIYIDVASYDVHEKKYERDIFQSVSITWWREIGPLPEAQNDND